MPCSPIDKLISVPQKMLVLTHCMYSIVVFVCRGLLLSHNAEEEKKTILLRKRELKVSANKVVKKLIVKLKPGLT